MRRIGLYLGEAFAKLIDTHRRAIETADLAERIAKLEQQQQGNDHGII